MMPPALNAQHDQADADHERIFGTGTIGYCPVCRRPASDRPIGPIEAMGRIARHLREAHDSLFLAALRGQLDAGDPFYPAGADH